MKKGLGNSSTEFHMVSAVNFRYFVNMMYFVVLKQIIILNIVSITNDQGSATTAWLKTR